MKNIIKDFFLEYYNNNYSFLRGGKDSQNLETTYKLAIRFLSYVFKDIPADTLNASTCLDLIEKGAQYPRLVELFWVYVCENNLTDDSILLRL